MSDTLVLLTTNFPAAEGDASFLANEIDALACAFDQVIVFSYREPSGPVVDLPPNVQYAGALIDTPKKAGLQQLLDVRALPKAAASLWREHRRSVSVETLRRTVGSISTGTAFARAIAAKLHQLGVTAQDRVTTYAFWGTHAAVALPFLDRSDRTVVRMHGFDLYEDRTPNLPLRASLFKAADAIVPISSHGKDYLLQRYPAAVLSPSKVKLSRLGTVDPGRLATVGKEQAWPKSGPLRVVSCSSLTPLKNVGAIIPAVEELARSGPVEWVHLGGGEQEEILRTTAGEAMARQPNLQISLRGWTPHSQVIEYLGTENPDVFLNVSDTEGVPVSIMEALSFGIPVVATDVGGTGEIVGRELGSGMLVPKRPSAEQISAAVREVTTNRNILDPRAVWERMSNAASNAQEIINILQDVQR